MAGEFKTYTGPMIVAVLASPLLGGAAAWHVESWSDSDSLGKALELALTPLAVLFALVFFLLEYNQRTSKATDDAESWRLKTRGALSITGAWAVAATLAILVHTAKVPNWQPQYTAPIAVGLTVAAFASLLVVPAIRHLLGQPAPQTDATPRAVARLVDMGVAAVLVGVVWALFQEPHEDTFKHAQLAYFISGLIIVGLYEFVFTGHRRSLGKLLCGLRVVPAVSRDGDVVRRSLSRFQAARRAIVVSAALTAAPAFFYGAVREVAVQSESSLRSLEADSRELFERASFVPEWLLLLAFVGGAIIMTSATAHPRARGIYDLLAGTQVVKDDKSNDVETTSAETTSPPSPQGDQDSTPDTQPDTCFGQATPPTS
ncbi:MAG: RDD family protein [Acidimicrobiaceae bacterium]|nr:RDD family protein [Acidimicrobiaceae bacterium]